jgi:DNA recombination protein RmuC
MLTLIIAGGIGAVLGAALAAVWFLAKQAALAASAAGFEAELAASRRAAEEQRAAAARAADDQRALLAQTQAQVRDTFAALSKDALKENTSDFLTSATHMLQPVRETLEKVQAQLNAVDKAREGSFQQVSSELRSVARVHEQLRVTTEGLSQSLRSPNVRGKWGEIQLKRIVELAGMLEWCDFIEKESTVSSEGARQTPDLIVKLPGNTNIVIDAKVPIDAYLSAANAKTDAERQTYLTAHARQVRDHVRALGAKEYWRQFQPAPEFVVMFLPLEPLLAAAFEEDGGLLDQAASLRVIPATPMTLLALLKAVAYGWQQRAVAQNAEEIQMLGRELYDRLAKMVEHVDDMGRNLRQATEGYNRFIGSLERQVLVSARRFRELGVGSTKTIEDADALVLDIRRVTHEELIGRPGELDLEPDDLPVLRRS